MKKRLITLIHKILHILHPTLSSRRRDLNIRKSGTNEKLKKITRKDLTQGSTGGKFMQSTV